MVNRRSFALASALFASSVAPLVAAAPVGASGTLLSDLIDPKGVIQSVDTYSTPGAWSGQDHAVLEQTLRAKIPGDPSVPYAVTQPSSDARCTLSTYSAQAVKYAVANCTYIVVDNLTTKPNTVIEFQGRTFWEFAEANYNLLQVGGVNLTVQGTPGSVLDGNGAAWWDGIGSNGGIAKPDHMIVASGISGYALFLNLYVKNAPTHVFSISNTNNLYMAGNVIDMKDGHKILDNNHLEAGHNTDGYDLSTTTNSLLTNNVVFNEDDCVAITSGQFITVGNFFCDGSHGLSIGSVGGKSNNTVADILFRDSTVQNAQNGARIKTNSGTTGSITRVTYDNIQVSNISIYGIDIQQDYLNGGPTGIPTPGVNITDITMRNIYGTVQPGAYNYYILVATPSTNAASWTFENVHITGGNASCDSIPAGFDCKSSLSS